MELRFRILNVFTVLGDRLSGNPLCVFEDGRALDDLQMQALARQFNLSETTFILPASPASPTATARVRIFTPTFEMPFAGHPTLGTAYVARALLGPSDDRVLLEMRAGDVEVVVEPAGGTSERWTLRTAHPPRTRRPAASREALAAMLSLPSSAIAEEPLWVDTGSEQLVLPLARPEDVRLARPDARLLAEHGEKGDESLVYVWSRSADDEILSRFFFMSGDSLVEDPATGSACANLGGWFLASRRSPPFAFRVRQGESVGRPSLLHLRVDEASNVHVGGAVEELGTGTIRL